ncbi:MAG: hypothetical protein MR019_07705 [Ruminococcus sp.]|nr:hypothetical protein [Ruminococcus sp.]MDY3895659.1 proline-rich domain-containing protein [Candidatus Fimenecus sp.]
MKKAISIICTLLLLAFTLSSCTKANTEYAGKTVTGKITSIDKSTVTLALGEISENTEMPSPPSDGGQSDNGQGDSKAPPEKPDNDSQNGETPPEKPDGDSQNGETPPEKPSGDSSDSSADKNAPNGDTDNAPSGGAPGGNVPGTGAPGKAVFTESGETAEVSLKKATVTEASQNIEISALSVGDIITVTFDDKGKATSAEKVNSENGNSSSAADSTAKSANTIDSDGTYSDTAYYSVGDDENALLIDGKTVTLENITVNKSAGASSNTENGDFYGINAAVLVKGGAVVDIKNATVSSSAQNGNGVFCYGSGTTVNISDSTITTTADNSGGIQTTGGGTTNAENLTVSTAGNSSAAIRSDRGGGTVNVTGGTYKSSGYNSPAVYSTAAITVKDAVLTAENSEALVIEGENSISLTNCTVSGNMSDTKGTSSDENVHNVMIYQSMSGDANVGTSSFAMDGGTLTSYNGDMFYITNTVCKMSLSGVTLTNNDPDALLMNVTGNSASHGWGTAGKNGADVTFTANAQVLEGKIRVDTISKLNMTLSGGSIFTGSVNIENNNEGGEAVANNAVITIDSGCTWNLTADCTVTSLTNNGTINFNGHTITLADGTVLS